MTHETVMERYLRQATRGLWGRKRREVREELEAHLHDRVMAYRIGGLGEAEAVERALAELGSPQEVSVGMTRIYTLPTVMGSGAALAAACVVVVALLPKGAAQALPVIPYWPSVECVEALDAGKGGFSSGQCFGFDDTLWFNQQVLREVLEPQGVTFERVPAPESDEGLLGITFPNSTPVYVSLGSSGYYIQNEDGSRIEVQPGYLSLWTLLRAVSLQKDVETRVSGWDSPTVRFSDVSLQIGTKEKPVTGYTFYKSYMSGVYFDHLRPDHEAITYLINPRPNAKHNSRFGKVSFQKAVLNVPDAARNAYGIAIRLDPAETLENTPSGSGLPDGEVWGEAVSLSVSRADAQGNVSFMIPEGSLHFVKAFTTKLGPGAAVLVKLNSSGTNWYEVVAPESITVR